MVKNKTIKEISSLMFKDKRTLLLMIVFDVLFVVLLLSLRFVQVSIDNALFPLFSGWGGVVYSTFYVIFEVFLAILVYSFFKYFIIKFIHESFEKIEFKIKDFVGFLKLNLIIFIPLIIVIAFILDLVIVLLNNWLSQGGIDPFMFVFVALGIGVLALILFIWIYTFINMIQFSFFKGESFWRLLKKGIVNSFRTESYKIYWDNFKIILVFAVFLLIVHLLAKYIIFSDFSSYIKNIGNYKIFIYWMITLVIYFIVLFNRFKFHKQVFDVSKGKHKELSQ